MDLQQLRIKFNCIPALVLLLIPIFIFIPIFYGTGTIRNTSNSTRSNDTAAILIDILLSDVQALRALLGNGY